MSAHRFRTCWETLVSRIIWARVARRQIWSTHLIKLHFWPELQFYSTLILYKHAKWEGVERGNLFAFFPCKFDIRISSQILSYLWGRSFQHWYSLGTPSEQLTQLQNTKKHLFCLFIVQSNNANRCRLPFYLTDCASFRPDRLSSAPAAVRKEGQRRHRINGRFAR